MVHPHFPALQLEEQLKENSDSPSKSKKGKKSFFPPEHLFKYELEEIEPDEQDLAAVSNTFWNDAHSIHDFRLPNSDINKK